jgi:hypothetical protein
VLPVCVQGKFHCPFLKLFGKNSFFSHDTPFFDQDLTSCLFSWRNSNIGICLGQNTGNEKKPMEP